MSDVVKWSLIGLGAYLLYESFATPAAAAASAAPVNNAQGAVPVQNSLNTTAAYVPPTAPASNLEILHAIGPEPVLIAAHNGGDIETTADLLTAPQWDWWLNQVSGINANDVANTGKPLLSGFLPGGNTATTPIGIAVWWAAILNWAAAQAQVAPAVAGVSGLEGLGYRDATETAQFATPPAPGEGRFDFVDEAWA